MLKFRTNARRVSMLMPCHADVSSNTYWFEGIGAWVAALVFIAMLSGVPSRQAQAALITDVAVTWNTVVFSQTDPFSVITFQTNSSGGFGFSAPHVDYVLGSSVANSTGITIERYVAPGGANHLRFLDVPTAISDTHYVEFTVTPKAGYAFDPGWFALSGIQNLNGALDYHIRTSLDGFGSVLTGASWGRTSGCCYRDLELDLTSLPLITEATTFRLLFKDNDGLVGATSSTATWPYGFRIYGGIENAPIIRSNGVPLPATVLLTLFGGLLGFARQRRQKAQCSTPHCGHTYAS